MLVYIVQLHAILRDTTLQWLHHCSWELCQIYPGSVSTCYRKAFANMRCSVPQPCGTRGLDLHCGCRPSSAGSEAAVSPASAGLFWRKHRLTSPQGLSLSQIDQPASDAAASDSMSDVSLMAEPLENSQDAATASQDGVKMREDACEVSWAHDSDKNEQQSAQAAAPLQRETGTDCTRLQQDDLILKDSCDADGGGHAGLPLYQDHTSDAARSPIRRSMLQQNHSQQSYKELSNIDLQSQPAVGGQSAAMTACPEAQMHIAAVVSSWAASSQLSDIPADSQCSFQQADCQTAAHAASQGQTIDVAGANVYSPSAGVQPAGSPFLQRLARQKAAAPILVQSTPVQSADERPPTPERPLTPFSRPVRRRNFVPMSEDASAHSSSEGWQATSTAISHNSKDQQWETYRSRAAGLGENEMFAPMHDMDSTYMASIAAKLAMRPASASAAQPPLSAGSALSWTGSMQLPPGMLLGAAQQQHLLSKAPKRYNWGFDSPNRV